MLAIMGIPEFLIWIVVVAACCGIVYLVVTQVFGIKIPDWFVKIVWIVLAALVAIVAIHLVVSFM